MVKESNHTLDAREELVGVNVMKNKELPSKCPECGYESEDVKDSCKGIETYDWKQIEPETNTRDATCNKCETTFYEIYDCVGWERL